MGSSGGIRGWLANLPKRIVRSVPWAHVEPAGLGVGSPEPGDLDEREERKRQAEEVWRSDEADRSEPAADDR